ncbi:hypothetical protein [Streptomonospora wellingtoniae]|uniref:DUF2746 domain-containing protein n=1 Tax=Streptomonospora wellingtoniae TaxID=3075544 RepID=A0ABU2L0H4_9ACTN|nr:hypothetical protein [Streptomonospora sp. DSM 45055]MDT0305054.1 hypothetical protein [Streptomonospora sp. DSM 45055]
MWPGSLAEAGPWLLGAAGVVGAAGVLIAAARKVWTFGRRVGHFLDDWTGEAARRGVEARPGVMERLCTIEDRLGAVEHEVRTNDGSSLKDAVRRTEVHMAELRRRSDP